MNENRRVGDDFVFSLPKDVGAYIMLLPPAERDAMLAMVGGRVGQVMQMIEADVETRVRKDGAFENRPGDGLAYGGLPAHDRPAGGRASRPIRIPTGTCSAFNATRDPVEGGRIKAADFANIYRDRPFYEAAFYSLVAKIWRKPGCRLSGGPMANGAWPGCNRWGRRSPSVPTRSRMKPGGSTSPMPAASPSWGQRRARRKTRNYPRRSCDEEWDAQLNR